MISKRKIKPSENETKAFGIGGTIWKNACLNGWISDFTDLA